MEGTRRSAWPGRARAHDAEQMHRHPSTISIRER